MTTGKLTREEKRKRNLVARDLHENKGGAYRIRIVESKKRQDRKLRPIDVVNLTFEDEFDDYTEY
jgi:hypothetical protein